MSQKKTLSSKGGEKEECPSAKTAFQGKKKKKKNAIIMKNTEFDGTKCYAAI